MVHVVLMAAVYGVLFLGQVEIGFSKENKGSYVKGIVSFHGKIPNTETKHIEVDTAVCGNVAQISGVHVETHTRGLQDVVVSIHGVSVASAMAPPTERSVENANCIFKPEVLAARQGETLAIYNRDPILHNTHITAGKRTVVNVAQVAGSRPILKKLKYTGSHVIRCDKHRFMSATLQVFAHPYFSVTDKRGAFHIPDLPAGTYTMVVWHETLGSLKRKITVPAQGGLTVKFDYP